MEQNAILRYFCKETIQISNKHIGKCSKNVIEGNKYLKVIEFLFYIHYSNCNPPKKLYLYKLEKSESMWTVYGTVKHYGRQQVFPQNSN